MELQLQNYTAEQILVSYEFIFTQYLGGQLSPPEFLEKVPTPYIFGEICGELRKQYLGREDAKVESIQEVEKGCIARLSQLMNINEKQLRELYMQMVIKSEDILRKIGQEKI